MAMVTVVPMVLVTVLVSRLVSVVANCAGQGVGKGAQGEKPGIMGMRPLLEALYAT